MYIFEFLKKRISIKLPKQKKRQEITNDNIYICIHEWGGYPLKRQKKVKKIKPFECGLNYQLERFNICKKKYNIDLTVTLSDSFLCKDIDYIKSHCDNLMDVDNLGFDFSGYSAFFDKVKNKENAYIILSNSSVNSDINDFLDDYLSYMNENKDVGILGISYSTSMSQTIIRNNFNPHLQSFFLLTTIDVLNDIVKNNNETFPGKNIGHKLLLIREGEIRVSKIALNLGYSLAVVLESGKIFKFNKTNKNEICYSQWKDLPKGDMRIHVNNPNKINTIIQK